MDCNELLLALRKEEMRTLVEEASIAGVLPSSLALGYVRKALDQIDSTKSPNKQGPCWVFCGSSGSVTMCRTYSPFATFHSSHQ